MYILITNGKKYIFAGYVHAIQFAEEQNLTNYTITYDEDYE